MEPHERFDAELNRRRLELRLQWTDIAKAAGITDKALRAMRRGSYGPSELTARVLDEALRWKPGSVEAILAGGDPAPLDEQVEPPAVLRNLRQLLETNPAAAQAIYDLIESIQRGPQLPEPSQTPEGERDERRDIG